MAVKRVIKGVHVVPMGKANAFLIEGDDGLTLIDAGYPGKEAAVFGAIRGLGHSLDQLKHLIFTHGHPDHIGSAAAIVRETGARTYLHPLDIPMVESGGHFRPDEGGARSLLGRGDVQAISSIPTSDWSRLPSTSPLTDGEILPIAGGMRKSSMFLDSARDRSRCCGFRDACCSRAMCARTSWASVIPSASRI